MTNKEISNNMIVFSFPEVEDKEIDEISLREDKLTKVIVELSKVVLEYQYLDQLLKTRYKVYRDDRTDLKLSCKIYKEELSEKYEKVARYTVGATALVSCGAWGGKAGAMMGGEAGMYVGLPVEGAVAGAFIGATVVGVGGAYILSEDAALKAKNYGKKTAKLEKKEEILNCRNYKIWKNERWRTNIMFLERIFPEIYNDNKNEIECGMDECIMMRPTKMSNGKIYEYGTIEEWLTNNNTDPQTREEISMEGSIDLTEGYYSSICEKFFVPAYNNVVDKLINARSGKLNAVTTQDKCFKLFFETSKEELGNSIKRAKTKMRLAIKSFDASTFPRIKINNEQRNVIFGIFDYLIKVRFDKEEEVNGKIKKELKINVFQKIED